MMVDYARWMAKVCWKYILNHSTDIVFLIWSHIPDGRNSNLLGVWIHEILIFVLMIQLITDTSLLLQLSITPSSWCWLGHSGWKKSSSRKSIEWYSSLHLPMRWVGCLLLRQSTLQRMACSCWSACCTDITYTFFSFLIQVCGFYINLFFLNEIRIFQNQKI